MKKRNSIIFSLISLLLIVAAIVGVVFLVKKIDEIPTSSNKTDPSTDSSDSSNNTGSSGTTDDEIVTPAAFYVDESTKTGYSTVAGTTYFFKEITYEEKVAAGADSVTIHTAKSYGGYSVNLYWSYDATLWTSYASDSTNHAGPVSHKPSFYICYTSIQNCANPDVILAELSANVFTQSTYFEYQFESGIG